MLQWLRFVIFPELRGVPVEQRTKLMGAAVLRAMTDFQVHVAGLACSLCAGLGAIAGGRLITGVLHSDPLRFFGGLITGAIVGGAIGGAIYATVLLARTRPRMRAASSAAAGKTAAPR